MKKILYFLLVASLFGCSIPKKGLDNTFYCFSNAANLPDAPEGVDAQAEFFKRLGFDGWGGHYGAGDYFARRAALDNAGLKLPEIMLRACSVVPPFDVTFFLSCILILINMYMLYTQYEMWKRWLFVSYK